MTEDADEAFEALLLSCDQALANRQPLPDLPPDLRPKLETHLALLRLLREELPPRLPVMALESPLKFGRFLLRRELGRGGFGIVYLADDPQLHRQVALKVPRPEVLASPELRQRFVREAQAAAQLDHPSVVAVYEAGEIGPVCYIASAYCAGPNLAAWLKQRSGPVEPQTAARLLADIASAVQHAHARGILHRDLKPSNILLVPDNSATGKRQTFVPKLTDFGLAKVKEIDDDQTSSGVLMGTPPYMAPEQAEGWLAKVGPATDVYALGVILYEMLTGSLPFRGPSLLATLEQIRFAEPAMPRRRVSRVPVDLDTICLQCLHKEPDRRYATAGALADDLERYLRKEPIQARRRGWVDRLRSWARRPERIREAGLFGLFFGILDLMIILTYLGALVVGVVPGDLQRWLKTPFVFQMSRALPSILIGIFTLRRRRFAVIAGLIFPPVQAIHGTLIGMNKIDSGGVFTFLDPGLQFVTLGLTVGLFGGYFVAYVLALIAYYANRDAPGFLSQEG